MTTKPAAKQTITSREWRDRISIDANVCAMENRCIKGTRVMVSAIFDYLSALCGGFFRSDFFDTSDELWLCAAANPIPPPAPGAGAWVDLVDCLVRSQ